MRLSCKKEGRFCIMSKANADIIIDKIDGYIRRYYQLKIAKGALLLFIYALGAFLLFTLLEHFYQFDVIGRTVLFFSFLISFLAIAYFFIISHIIALLKPSSRLSYRDAAIHIGAHFEQVNDKLLNMLQLRQQALEQENPLILASIAQKVEAFGSIKFSSAIDFSTLRTYFKYLSLPALTLVIVLFLSPKVITESSSRIINFTQAYQKQAPFEFNIINKELKALQYESFELEVKVEGSVLPGEVNLIMDGQTFRLDKQSKQVYKYIFPKVNKAFSFQLEALDYQSQAYWIKVVPKALVESFSVNITYPDYLSMENTRLDNLGNFTVPSGTKIDWEVNTKNVSKLRFKLNDTTLFASAAGDNMFTQKLLLTKSLSYSMIESNRDYVNSNPAMYFIKVIKDQYPTIKVNTFRDSLNSSLLYFTGDISDDYGFKDLVFYYKAAESDRFVAEALTINKDLSAEQFHYLFDFKAKGFNLGSSIDYFFTVRDNDQLNGFKSTKTPTYIYRLKSRNEIIEDYKTVSSSLKSNMQKRIEEANALHEQIRALKDKIISKKEMDWADKKEFEEIKKKQAALRKELEALLKEKAFVKQQQKSIGEENDQLRQKQELLEQMLQNLMNDEVDEMMQKIESMMEKLNKEDLIKEMDKLSNSNENVSDDLEKLKELYKKLEFEYQFQEAIDHLKQLAQKQKEIAQNKRLDKDSLFNAQSKINEEFKNFKDKMDALEKLDNSMDKPQGFEKDQQAQEEISKTQSDVQSNLSKGDKSKAKAAQKKSAEQMDNLAQKMQAQMQQIQQAQMAIDYEILRQILDNVLTLSFDQEELLNAARLMNRNSPHYRSTLLEQYKIKDNLQIVEDSLRSISKRVFQIKGFINEELLQLNTSIDYALNAFEQLKFNRALTNQQYAITSLNNIALMLNESLNDMQAQMNSMQSGSKSCNKPGKAGGNKSQSDIEKLRKMNEALGQKMKGIKESEGKGKMGSKGIAQLAKEQAQVRQMLQQLNEQYNKDGLNKLGNLEEILKKMEQNEKDIVNKKLSEQLYRRQQLIETRLLKAQSALRQQDKSPDRVANEAVEFKTSLPPAYLEYKKNKEKQVELLRSIPPKFRPFYKKIVNDYFKSISN